MAAMTFAVERDGRSVEVDVDVSADMSTLTLRELVRLEEAIGTGDMARLVRGELDITPRILQAIIWTKLASEVEGIPLEAVDLPAGVV